MVLASAPAPLSSLPMVLMVPQPVKNTAASNGSQKSLRMREFKFFSLREQVEKGTPSTKDTKKISVF
jgi:hypothetical protein